uniref:NADH dehydrogenase subunit 4L n=1 Tax=Vorticeros sp. n. MW-2019 TaxID=2544881 RepID=A0AA50AHG6_9PLAT|nr:NADH dehydrogenase subunit 4L [Vorticeros sp. n. MW-2019]
MNSVYINFLILLFLINIIMLINSLNHLLLVLLVFEFMGLNILFFYLVLSEYSMSLFGLIYLVILACEASIGLSILVSLVRSNYLNYVGNNNMFNI